MPSSVSRPEMARRRELAAEHLRALLSGREKYRSRWACLAGNTLPGEISQAAVARVIVDHLRKDGSGSKLLDYRLLKDRVCRALSGRALTQSTLGLFTSAFLFNDEDIRHLRTLLLGPISDESQAAFQPSGFNVAVLEETHEVNSEGRPQSHRVRQTVTATKDGMSRYPLYFDPAPSAIEVSVGDLSEIYKCGEELFAVDVVLPKALMRDETFDLEYVVEYAADAKADPEFLRAALGKYIDSATIKVKFSPSKPPSTVWWMVRSNLGGVGRTVIREPVEIDQSLSVCKTVMAVDDVVIGFGWEW